VALGIIAEDNSDVEVLHEIAKAILHPKKFGIKRFVGNGCGRLRRKCRAWAANLVRQGCPWIIVAHDQDQYDESKLRHELEQVIAPVNARASVVLIPIREIEAWLMYDSHALRLAFNGGSNLRVPGDPESIYDPKKALRDLIWRAYKKDYVSTIHNGKIASKIDCSRLRKSKSFARYPAFLNQIRKEVK
jgi:hypothetical protein